MTFKDILEVFLLKNIFFWYKLRLGVMIEPFKILFAFGYKKFGNSSVENLSPDFCWKAMFYKKPEER